MSDKTNSFEPFVPSDEAQKLYAEFIAETRKRELSGSEGFDKAVLTLSSAGLGLSISFLKDFIFENLGSVVLPWLLYASWLMFSAATLSTMISFLVSGKALKYQEEIAERAYLQGKVDAFNEANPWAMSTSLLNAVSAGAFFSALVLTLMFIIINLEHIRISSTTASP